MKKYLNTGKIANGTFDIKMTIMKNVYNCDDFTTISNKLGITKAIDDKFGWKTTDNGLTQKITKTVTQAYPFVKAYGIGY